MEEGITALFALVSIVLAVVILHNILDSGTEGIKDNANEQALDALSDKCEYVCSSSKFDAQLVTIEVSAGTIFYTGDDRVCYEKDEVRCRLCPCEVIPRTMVDLRGEVAEKAFDKHQYKCNIVRDDEINITCRG